MRRPKLSENDQIELVTALFDRLTIPLAAAGVTMLIVGIIATLRAGDMAFGFVAAATVLSCAGRLFVIRLFHREFEGRAPDIETALTWRARFLRFNRLQASMVGLFVFHCLQTNDSPLMLLGCVFGLGYVAGVIALGQVAPEETTLTACFAFVPFVAGCLLQREPIYLGIVVVATIYVAGGYTMGQTNYTMMCNQIRMKSMFAEMARLDPLTGLLNRSALHGDIRELVSAGDVAIHSIDLDRFKAANDTYGHAAGDAVLRIVASRLREIVSERDLVFRMGGDEFLIVQSSVKDRHTAERLAERILSALAAPCDFAGHKITIGASVGIALIVDAGSVEASLVTADEALYIAKRRRNAFYFADAKRGQASQVAAVA